MGVDHKSISNCDKGSSAGLQGLPATGHSAGSTCRFWPGAAPCLCAGCLPCHTAEDRNKAHAALPPENLHRAAALKTPSDWNKHWNYCNRKSRQSPVAVPTGHRARGSLGQRMESWPWGAPQNPSSPEDTTTGAPSPSASSSSSPSRPNDLHLHAHPDFHSPQRPWDPAGESHEQGAGVSQLGAGWELCQHRGAGAPHSRGTMLSPGSHSFTAGPGAPAELSREHAGLWGQQQDAVTRPCRAPRYPGQPPRAAQTGEAVPSIRPFIPKGFTQHRHTSPPHAQPPQPHAPAVA